MQANLSKKPWLLLSLYGGRYFRKFTWKKIISVPINGIRLKGTCYEFSSIMHSGPHTSFSLYISQQTFRKKLLCKQRRYSRRVTQSPNHQACWVKHHNVTHLFYEPPLIHTHSHSVFFKKYIPWETTLIHLKAVQLEGMRLFHVRWFTL